MGAALQSEAIRNLNRTDKMVLKVVIKNDIAAKEIKIETEGRAEMVGVKIHLPEKDITIYNCYCPPTNDHVLHAMTKDKHCIVVGDFK